METTVFTEILPNIQSTNINFGIPVTNKLKSIYKLEISPLEITFEPKQKEGQPQQPKKITLKLSQTIETSDSPSITTSLDSLDIKLKLRSYVRKKLSRESSLLSSSNKLPFSATEITINNFINILCGSCKISLLRPVKNDDNNIFTKILDMPSEHWIELLDCWMCHQEEYPQAQFILNDIIVKENICLIGNTYYLIFPTNVKDDVIKIDDNNNYKGSIIDWTKGLSRKWRPMSCSRCLRPIGEGLYSMEDKTEGEPILMAVKFNKYMTAIKLKKNDDDKDSFIRMCQFNAVLAADFLEAAKAHATYRFIIEGQKMNKPYILIWLFDWDTKIMTNALQDIKSQNNFSPDVIMTLHDLLVKENEMKINDVMKLLYIDCTFINNDNNNKILEEWIKDKTVEHFKYHDDICLQLLVTLKTSMNSLPFSKRVMMNDFNVGYLII